MKKLIHMIFCVLFVALLLLPLLFTNFKKDQVSEIDNTCLPEIDWPESIPVRTRVDEIDEYLNMRIGFRSQALNGYLRFNDRLFGLMDHPSYMYGRNGHVFFGNDNYIRDYQHLNLDRPWAEHFAGWMQTFSDMSREHGADFYYVLIPDKKTVYSEYFPAGCNICGDVSRTDQVLEELRKTDVSCYYALDVLLREKELRPVANVKYDAGHWNENGCFVTLQALIELLREKHPEIPPLTPDEFETGTEHEDTLTVSYFPIDEDVPVYTRIRTGSIEDSDWLEKNLRFPEWGSYRTRYVDPEHPELPKLLVIHDSYLMHDEKFFQDHFSEVTFIHRYNLKGPHIFEEYLEILQPDIVIFENPERSFEIRFDAEQ